MAVARTGTEPERGGRGGVPPGRHPAAQNPAPPSRRRGGGGFWETAAAHAISRLLVDAVLRSYSQILLNRSRLVAVVLVAATAVSPVAALFGLGAALLAAVVALAMQLDRGLIASGLYGYSAMLVGLGAAVLFEPTGKLAALAALAVVLSVLVTAALHAALGVTFNLPVLTLPFLLVFYLFLAAAPIVGLPYAPPLQGLPSSAGTVETYLASLGAIFFLPRWEAGLLMLAALLLYSRIAVVLSLLGFLLAEAVVAGLSLVPDPLLPLVLGYNFLLAAIALGGVWFVPSPTSFVLAAVGSLVCGLVSIGLLPLMARDGIPLLILPFNVTVILVLYAMRQRVWDRRPKAVDFLLGTPEANLGYFRTRLARFRARYFVRFRAPFMGRWTCTQSVDGEETHRGAWRHAFDFEVADAGGKLHQRMGASASDYYCYRLPVLAAADGTVARVVDGISDNVPGEMNLSENWGNLVLLYHGPGLYSLLCHLSPGSIKVVEGQYVHQGDTLGLCGSSGRSPRPHLHFHLQGTARVGAPTIEGELHDVVMRTNGGSERERLMPTLVPRNGDVLRNIEEQPDVAKRLQFPYGKAMVFRVTDGPRALPRDEAIVSDIDLYGSLMLSSPEAGGVLYYDLTGSMLTVYDVLAPRRSVLHLVRMALCRMPFDASLDLGWTDHLPVLAVTPWLARPLLDLVSPFYGRAGIPMEYAARRDGAQLLVEGVSTARSRSGEPLVRTKASLGPFRGIERLEVTVRGRTRTAVRVASQDSSTGDPDEAAGKKAEEVSSP